MKTKKQLYQKRWYEKNKIKIRKKARLFYLKNKEKIKEKHKLYRLENSDKIKKYSKNWYKVNKYRKEARKRARISHLKTRYNLTITDFKFLLKNQNNKCKICDKILKKVDRRSKNRNKPHIDHDHVTGKVRGLLCGHCNIMLHSIVCLNPELLLKAYEYLNEFKTKQKN